MDSIPLAAWVLEGIFLLVHVWALIAALARPRKAFQEAGHNKTLWVVLLIVAFFLPCIGWLLALWYLFSVDTSVKRVQRLGPRPGFPGGAPDY